MPLTAALFDVGDTLVEGWIPRERYVALVRDAVSRELGPVGWIGELGALDLADLVGEDAAHRMERQETDKILAAWFDERGIPMSDRDRERVRRAAALPLQEVSRLAAGAAEALRWCKERGLRVVLVSNTSVRGDAELRRDFEEFGLGGQVDGVVTSHAVGWLKPHPAMFLRALDVAGARPDEAVMVGDKVELDVRGARSTGIRSIWKRAPTAPAPKPEDGPDAVIKALSELPSIIERWR